jgi:hypothetical protein
MTEFLIALGSLLIGIGLSFFVGRYWFLQGLQLGRDERALEHGSVGSLEAIAEAADVPPAVGQSSGRHARIEWPDDPEVTREIQPVSRPEVRA